MIFKTNLNNLQTLLQHDDSIHNKLLNQTSFKTTENCQINCQKNSAAHLNFSVSKKTKFRCVWHPYLTANKSFNFFNGELISFILSTCFYFKFFKVTYLLIMIH